MFTAYSISHNTQLYKSHDTLALWVNLTALSFF